MKFWNLNTDTEIPEDGVLDIEGPISTESWFGDETSSKEFRQALKGMRNVTVHINSPGGDVMAGAEIYSALREHSMNGMGRVKVIITALAASAASVVAMAGDEILISPVAYMMIHNPWSMAVGDAREMRKTAKTLDEITEGLITAYQQRTGKSRDQLKRMLENETWMSAQTCVDEGFADGIYGGEIRAAACAGAGMLTRATPETIREMCARWEASRGEADEEAENPDDPEKEEPEDPEKAEKNAETGEDGGADPEEEDPEKTDDPEKEAEEPEDPEELEDPEEPEKPEKPDPEEEKAKRAEIARRAEILAGLEWQHGGGK